MGVSEAADDDVITDDLGMAPTANTEDAKDEKNDDEGKDEVEKEDASEETKEETEINTAAADADKETPVLQRQDTPKPMDTDVTEEKKEEEAPVTEAETPKVEEEKTEVPATTTEPEAAA